MKITAIVVGRVGAPLKDAIREYETRVGRYWKFNVIEVASGGGGSATTRPDRVIGVEETHLLARLPKRAEVVAPRGS